MTSLAHAIRMEAQGNLAAAIAVYRAILAAAPRQGEVWARLGKALRVQGDLQGAFEALQEALVLCSDDPDVLLQTALVLEVGQQPHQARDHFQAVLRLRPDLAEAWGGLGRVLCMLQAYADALVALDRAMVTQSGQAKNHFFRGVALRQLGRSDEALAALRQSIHLDPDDFDALMYVGVVQGNEGLDEAAIVAFEQATRLRPDSYHAHAYLGDAWANVGDRRRAVASYEQALAIQPEPSLYLKSRLAIPQIPASLDEIEAFRSGLSTCLDGLERQGIRLQDPAATVGTTPFYYAYHGQNDRPLFERLARFYLSACPSLAWEAPYLAGWTPPGPDRLVRVAYASHHFRDHIVAGVFADLMAALDRRRFHVTAFHVQPDAPTSAAIVAAADEIVCLRGSTEVMRAEIARHQLDILIYTDIGMDQHTYFLAFARLAPIQCVHPGHPVTTGIPNIDYYFTSAMFEPDDAEVYYTEQLVRFQFGSYLYEMPSSQECQKTREDFGLPEGVPLYACFQTLYKLHPEFDRVLGEILSRDSQARIVLVAGKHPAWEVALRQRFACTFPEAADRVIFLERLPYSEFLHLLTLVDALLDPFHFGGGSTALAALAAGQPVITLPGDQQRSRVTYGFYRRMGLLDPVAENDADFIEKALRLAHDPQWKQGLCEQIRQRRSQFFADEGRTDELTRFLESALVKAEA